jgi:PHD/YefM family antitoxin component YafN of YafNO toxin-antitoxin module
MNDTAHLLSTKANRKRLLESIAQDKKTSQALEKQIKNELKKAGKKKAVKY